MLDILTNESLANFATVVEAGATVIALLYARREWKDSKRQREQQVQEQLAVEKERMAQEHERAAREKERIKREEERINDQIRLLSIDLVRPVFISESQGGSGQTSGNCQAEEDDGYFEALRIINHSYTTFRNFNVEAWGFTPKGGNKTMSRFLPFLPQGEYILCLPSAHDVFPHLGVTNVNPLIPIDRLDELMPEKKKFFLSTRYRDGPNHQGFPEKFNYKVSCQDIRNTTWHIRGENGAIGSWQKNDEA